METMIMAPTLDEYVNFLPDGSHKSRHRIIVKRDSEDFTKVLTAFAVIDNESKELIAFVDLKWEKENHSR